MLKLNETFAVPDPDHAWTVINDLTTLVPCVPGASVKTTDGPQAVKATCSPTSSGRSVNVGGA